MPLRKPTLGYPSQTEACLALHAQGKSYREIASLIGSNRKHVSAMLSCRPNGRPRKTVALPPSMLDALEPHAAKRKTTICELVCRLVEIAVSENLIDAILDDGEKEAA